MDFDEIIKDQMKNVVDQDNLDSLSDYASNLSGGISEHFTIDKILEATLNGKSIFDSQEIITSLKELFLYEMKSALIVGVEILTICIVIGLLKNLSGSFSKKGVSDIASLTCSIVIIGLAMANFNTIYQLTIDSMKTIAYTMDILLPILIAILISMGQVASGTIMSPLLLTAITIFQTIIKNTFYPQSSLNSVVADQLFNRKRLRKPTIQIYKTAGVVRHRHHHDPHVWNYSDSRAYRQDVGQSFDRYGEVLYRRVYPNRRRIHS